MSNNYTKASFLLLVQPDEDGHAFDVVIASLPGYGLSRISAEPGWGCQRMAAVMPGSWVVKTM